jgi:hypothetical protein
MISETHKKIEIALDKQDVLFDAKVINFPKETNKNKSEPKKVNNQRIWEISNTSNEDQLKTVVGICLLLGSLILMGLYSNVF